MGTLIAPKAIGGIFMISTATDRIGVGFIDGVGGRLCLSLFLTGAAP
jgi:hypothetical protein